jgi:hypothetical protein
VSEDIVVPLDRLGEAITGTVEIGARHGLEACSWGHAGDGNLHSTFLVDPTDRTQLASAERASADLFALALALGGSISGEHGLGTVKRAYLPALLGPGGLRLARAVKDAFDPRGLLNPGKKLPPTDGLTAASAAGRPVDGAQMVWLAALPPRRGRGSLDLSTTSPREVMTDAQGVPRRRPRGGAIRSVPRSGARRRGLTARPSR